MSIMHASLSQPTPMKAYSALLAALVAFPAGAQPASQPAAATIAIRSAIASARELWKTSDWYIVSAAEQVPESRYDYKPTPEGE